MFRAITSRSLTQFFALSTRQSALFTQPLQQRMLPTLPRRSFSQKHSSKEIPFSAGTFFRSPIFSSIVIVLGLNCLFHYKYFQEKFQTIKLNHIHGEAHKIFLDTSKSSEELHKGNFFYSRLLFENSVENFSELLSKTLTCIQTNQDDMQSQLISLWGADDIQLINEKQKDLALKLSNLSNQFISATEKDCKEHCDQTKKPLAMIKAKELQQKIENFPFVKFSLINSSHWTFDTLEYQIKTKRFVATNERDFFEDFAEKCRQDYLLEQNPQAKQEIKEQFHKVSNKFLDKLKVEASQAEDKLNHRNECETNRNTKMADAAISAKSLSTELEAMLQSLTTVNKPSSLSR